MKFLGIGAGALAIGMGFGLGGGAEAATVMDVTWGAESQTVATLTGPGTGAAFYGLNSGSTTAPLSLDQATIYAFVHESTTTGALSFGMIFTGADIARPNPTCVASKGGAPSLCRTHFQGTLSGAPQASLVSVKDDPINTFGDSDLSAPGANGAYGFSAYTNATDGFVVDGVLPGNRLTMTAQLLDGFDSFVFIAGPAAAPTYSAFTFTPGQTSLTVALPATIGANTPGVTVIPLPAGGTLLVSAFALAGVMRLRRRAPA